MIPVLFNKEETTFTSLGLGEIDATVVEVERERNGIYSLYMELPFSSDYVALIEQEMQIKADAGARTKWQTFKVNRVIKDSDKKIVKVYADHISMDTINDAMKPRVAIRQQTAEGALRQWNANRISAKQYDVSSDISTISGTTWTIDEVENARQALGGVEGSILDVWGGEFEFDNNRIILHKEMGREAPTVLEYGRNIVSLEYEELIDGVYTSIYPYATYTPRSEDNRQQEPVIVTLDELIVDGDYVGNYQSRRVQIVDFSSEFDSSGDNPEVPTQAKLRSLAKSYVKANEVGAPKITQEVDFVDLTKTLDYSDIQVMEEIELNDRVPIFYPNIKITSDVKVTKTVWQPLINQYKKITVSTIGALKSSSLNNDLKTSIKELEKQQKQINNTVPYLINGQGNRIWYTTPDDTLEHKIGDTWFKKNGKYTIMYQWNGSMWEEVLNDETFITEIEAGVSTAIEEVEKAVQSAQDAVEQIDTAVANAGFTSLDETLNSVQSISNTAKTNAQTALRQSLDALEDASTALTNSQTSLDRADTAISSASSALTKAKDAQDAATVLSGQVSDFEITVDGFNQTVNNYEGQVSGFRSDISGLENTVANYETEVDEFGNTVSIYATEVSTMRNTVSGFESTVATYGAEVSGLAGDVTEYKNQVSTMTNTVNGFNSTVAQYTTEVDEFGKEVDSYATQVSTLENTVSGFKSSVDKVEADYKGVSGTVASHSTSISNLDEQIALKANTTTVNALTGRVSTAESSITANANAIKLKANQSSVDTLSGKVNTLSSDIDVTAGKISSKVWMSDIEDIEVGGRNYFSQSNYSHHSNAGYNASSWTSAVIEVEPNTEYTISYTVTESNRFGVAHDPLSNGVYASYTDPITLLRFIDTSRGDEVSVTVKTPNRKGYLVLYLSNQGNDIKEPYLMVEKGNKATDWTPAPEDTDAKINHVESELTQKHDSISTTVSSIDGRVAAQKQTIDSISSTVSGHDSRISTVEQTTSGLQSTVASKASQSQVTQLANGLSSVVSDLNNLEIGISNLVPHDENKWELGGYNLSNGNEAWNNSRFRTKNYIKVPTMDKLSLDSTSHGEFIILFYDANYNFKGSTKEKFDNVRKGTYNVPNGTEYIKATGRYSGDNSFSHISDVRLGTIAKVMAVIGSQIVDIVNWAPAPEDIATTSQITQLSDDINLRVSKGDLLSQINVQAGSVLIQSGTNKLNITPTTTYIQNGTIESAMIKSLDAGKITAGTLDASKVTVSNLDASRITGNLTEFIKTNWNAAVGGGVDISGLGVRSIDKSGSRVTMENGVISVGNHAGVNLGFFGGHLLNPDATGTMTMTASLGTEMAFLSATSADGKTYQRAMSIMAGASEIDMFTTLDMGQNPIRNAQNIGFNGGEIRARRDGNAGYMTYDTITGHAFAVSGTDRMSITSVVHIWSGIDMHGNDIARVGKLSYNSDERLKMNIKETSVKALEAIIGWRLVEYDWRANSEHIDIGLIAQHTPELLTYDRESDIYGIDAGKQTMINTLAIQQLNTKVDDKVVQLEKKIASLQDELALLKGA